MAGRTSGARRSLPPDDGEPGADGPDAEPEAPHGVPPDVAVRLLRALDRAPAAFAALIDANMRFNWLSDSTSWVTGTAPIDRTGRHSLELIHPDDVERIVHGLAQLRAATPHGTGAPVAGPLRFRIRRADGTWLLVEALVQNLLDDPIVRAFLVIGRPVGGVLDGVGYVVDLLTSHAPLPDVLVACAEIVPNYLGSAAIVGLLGDPAGWGEGASAPVIGVPEGSPVAALVADDRWWRPAVESGAPILGVDFVGYPEDLVQPARAAGFRSAWALPLLDDATGEALGCLVVWSWLVIEPNIGIESGLRQTRRLATLVIGEERRHAALQREASTDPLTGLGNRAALRRRLARSPGPVTVALIDLDGFKPVNDTHGHNVGDWVLEVIAARLMNTVRDDDCVVRFGGDEFAVVFADDLPAEAVRRSTERLQQVVEAPITIGPDQAVAVGASIGVASALADDVVPLADKALYGKKRSKRLGSPG